MCKKSQLTFYLKTTKTISLSLAVKLTSEPKSGHATSVSRGTLWVPNTCNMFQPRCCLIDTPTLLHGMHERHSLMSLFHIPVLGWSSWQFRPLCVFAVPSLLRRHIRGEPASRAHATVLHHRVHSSGKSLIRVCTLTSPSSAGLPCKREIMATHKR